MRRSTIVMIAVAAVFGVLSVFMAQSWLNRQADARLRSLAETPKPVSTRMVVVAKSPLRFGNPITPQSLREVSWPNEAIPQNSFSSIAELTKDGKRAVLASIEPNEPIVAAKITGPGQKATLSAILDDGMKAVTIRVNDVGGVAGFVLPGDRVDVLLTRQSEKESGASDVVLQNIKVLGIDQMADERAEKPIVGKAVTLEVDTVSAQKLALAETTGALSLALRKAGDTSAENNRRVTVTDIGSGAPAAARGGHVTINVIRAEKKEQYSVPVEGQVRLQAGEARLGDARQ